MTWGSGRFGPTVPMGFLLPLPLGAPLRKLRPANPASCLEICQQFRQSLVRPPPLTLVQPQKLTDATCALGGVAVRLLSLAGAPGDDHLLSLQDAALDEVAEDALDLALALAHTPRNLRLPELDRRDRKSTRLNSSHSQ